MTHGSYTESRRALYRSRNGAILGVCKGLADYMDFSVFWTRVIVLVSTLFTGIWPGIGLYFLAGLLMKPEPVLPLESEDDREFYHSYTGSRTMAVQRLKRMFDNLDRRIQRMEDIVTARDFDWERRLKE
jgi:phage shock protein C